jgi:hypothetical protein
MAGTAASGHSLGAMQRFGVLFAAAAAVLLAGCTATGGATSVETIHTTTTETLTPSAPPTGAIPVGAVTQADGNCPLVDEATAASDEGVRMGRVVVLTAGGAPVGCDFFADPAWAVSEHLPGPNQPILAVTTTRYADATAAHNAMVSTANAGVDPHAATVKTLTGVSYQTTFDPADGAKDWAFVFSSGSTLVTVLTAQSDAELDARLVAGDLTLP